MLPSQCSLMITQLWSVLSVPRHMIQVSLTAPLLLVLSPVGEDIVGAWWRKWRLVEKGKKKKRMKSDKLKTYIWRSPKKKLQNTSSKTDKYDRILQEYKIKGLWRLSWPHLKGITPSEDVLCSGGEVNLQLRWFQWYWLLSDQDIAIEVALMILVVVRWRQFWRRAEGWLVTSLNRPGAGNMVISNTT